MNLLQIQASDPKFSSWVSASAGTGKTKILTDRVLRLLLCNADFRKILCLTFTNAAAGEMKERIASALADWANSKEEELAKKLYSTLGRVGTKKELDLARSLYNQYLTADERVNVQTIHSFCQKLLKKFPLEAGLSPSFTIIDETKAYTILQHIKKELLNKDELAPINDYLNANFHEVTIDTIISDIVQNKIKFFNENYQYDCVFTESQKIIESLNSNDSEEFEAIISYPIIQDIVGFNQTAGQIKKFFLTDSGLKRKRIVTQKIAKAGSNLYSDLEMIQEQVFAIDQQIKSKQLEQYSKLICILGKSILDAYENHKAKKGLLDYDDLIIYTSKLLKSSDARAWVLYKLDGGIDHLLVDEAQDTSFNQWQIVESLIEEFYSGDSKETEQERTVFVVGDEKQSIFSFQGADVHSFSRMNSTLKERMQQGGKKFTNVQLEISYRSAKEILDGVHLVFDRIYKQMPGLFTEKIQQLIPHRAEHSGSIEIWPLCANEETKESFWPISDDKNVKSPQTILAEKISSYIKKQLLSNRIIPATGKQIAPEDFMILFRKRDELTHEVIHALKNENIEVTGLDRIFLCDNLAVMDLLSIAKFIVSPDDDLNLCSLLKSPLIGLTEKEIYKISNERQKNSVWEYINLNSTYQNLSERLQIFIDLHNITHVGNFFQYIVDVLGYRNILNANCGSDSNDAIDELLHTCSNFILQNNNSLQSFIFWIEEYSTSIKRDSSGADKVRIMTMHASKGLQSPFVILCDTTSTPKQSDMFFWNENGNLLSAKNSSSTPEYFNDLKKIEQNKTYAEYLRLLYVGMTRAEDHLIICGFQGTNSIPENCWYQLVRSSLSTKSEQDDEGKLIFGTEEKLISTKEIKEKSVVEYEICYANKNSKFTINQPKYNTGYASPSPISEKDPMGYGLIFHKILEDSLAVPDLAIMKTHPLIQTLTIKAQNRMQRCIDRIISNQELCELIKEDFRTEIAIGTTEDNSTKVGRIDLMIIKKSEIKIIDYKSDINPPEKQADIPQSYITQLNFYTKIVQKIYPQKNIQAMILWLENGNLMEIPKN
jgi:ATP-dependent helicase/nuclease subunit A